MASILVRTLKNYNGKCFLAHSLLSCSVICGSRTSFYGEYRRAGQSRDNSPPWKKIRFSFAKGVEGVQKHFGLLKEEILGRWVGPQGRPLKEHMLEQTRVQWDFRGPDSLKQWIVSSDQEIGGRSEVYLELSRNSSTCLVHGTLCSTPPRDGETRYSGYCTLCSRRLLVS